MQKVIAEINLKNIRENAKIFKSPACKLCAVVKADAYGHGAERVTCALSDIADMFAVALLEEGIAISTAACGRQILVLTPPKSVEEAEEMIAYGLLPTVDGLVTARLVLEAANNLKSHAFVHLKVNTGMNRYGMNASMLGRVCRYLQGTHVLVEGLYSHLYTHSKEICEVQRERFDRAREICKRYYPNVCFHLSATHGALLGEAYAYDMIRVGLGLYGYLPVEKSESEKQRLYSRLPALKKAMTVTAVATHSKRYTFGGVGYGERPTDGKTGEYLTVYRYGYADGFPRAADKNLPIGTFESTALCMDVRIAEGRHVRGKPIKILTDAEENARRQGTSVYEVLCSVTRRAERIYAYV